VNRWALATMVYMCAQFLHLKLVVIQGWSRQMARLEGIDLYDQPSCVGYVYWFSELWR
jgi:hypothetical protein